MRTADWAVQGVCGLLSLFLWRQWWKQDPRILLVSKILAGLSMVVLTVSVLVWAAYSAGALHQSQADWIEFQNSREAVNTELRSIYAAVPVGERFESPVAKRVLDVTVRPGPEMRAQLAPGLSLRSIALLVAYMLTLTVVTTVSLASHSNQRPKPGDGDSDEKRPGGTPR